MIKSVGDLVAEFEYKVDEVSIEECAILGDLRALEIILPHSKEQTFTTLNRSLQKFLEKVQVRLKQSK